jgi:hypothetical protein
LRWADSWSTWRWCLWRQTIGCCRSARLAKAARYTPTTSTWSSSDRRWTLDTRHLPDTYQRNSFATERRLMRHVMKSCKDIANGSVHGDGREITRMILERCLQTKVGMARRRGCTSGRCKTTRRRGD